MPSQLLIDLIAINIDSWRLCPTEHIILTTGNHYNIIGKWLSSQRFPSPDPIGRGLLLRPPSANQGARRGRWELPLGETPRSRRTRRGQVPIPGSAIPPYISNSDNAGTKTVIPSPTGRSLIGWGSYIEPADPGDDKFISPGQTSFHTSTTPTTRGS